MDEIQGRGRWGDCIYLYLEKALDKAPHNKIIWKLEHVGGKKGKLFEWVRGYLSDREMRTTIKNANSNWCNISSGVSQGSVVALIMFNTYINNIVGGTNSYMNLFLNYTKLLQTVKGKEDYELLQKYLNNT